MAKKKRAITVVVTRVAMDIAHCPSMAGKKAIARCLMDQLQPCYRVRMNSKRHPYVSDRAYVLRIKANTVVDSNDCWTWQGFRHKPPRTYGLTSYRGQKWRVHRLMYTLLVGPIDPGKVVCHTCDNPGCCNPAHLWLGTHHDNMADCRAKNRYHYANLTHCKNGHEFNEQNTYIIKTPGKWQGLRACKMCQIARNRIKAGWSRDEAFSTPRIPPGTRTARRTFNGRKRDGLHVEGSPK